MKEFETGEYQSYEEFLQRFKLEAPDGFNFAYDVVDRLAAETPDRVALVWCDEKGASKVIRFAEMKEYSDRVAGFLKRVGIKKGDRVMLILKRRTNSGSPCWASIKWARRRFRRLTC